ncbi:MAG TPA: hypothetical protein VIM11_28200 [Tepidisphaeraceae bacterium]|jgi:hypothetical protein
MGPPYTSFEGDILDVFVHGRRTSSGAERLVAVSFDSSTFMVGDPQPFTVCIYTPGKFLRSGNWNWMRCGLGFKCNPGEPLRLYGGQPDLADCSHFTIRYSAGNRSGVIDGWLNQDANAVTMSARGDMSKVN